MDRLDFVLPEFTRISWVDDAARGVYEPKLASISRAWLDVEWRSVASGVRRCCLAVTAPEDLADRVDVWAKYGLTALPIFRQRWDGSLYTNFSTRAKPGEPFVFRVALGTPRDGSLLKDAFEARDDRGIGELLGYPACCIEFFRSYWVERQFVDTTWPMACETASPPPGSREIEVNGPPEVNVLWRWMGIRAVPHLPCRFDCQPSATFGREQIVVGREAGFGSEMDWLLEILDWPVEWSCLHGIAEVRTPVLKVSTQTDATGCKYTVRRTGGSYPIEGARGLVFPWHGP